MRVVLAGGEAAGVRALRLLVDRGLVPHAVAAADPGMATATERAGIEAVDSKLLADAGFADWIADQRIDLLINAHSLHIVHGEVLAALRIGGYNLHPGPLPSYAGLNVPSWAIINGEQRHAVTLHQMTPVVDAGGVVATAWFDLDERSTGLSVSSQCARLGIELLADLVDRLVDGDTITTTPISGERRLYRQADRPNDGRVRWQDQTDMVDRLIRGCSFHPMSSPIGTPSTTSSTGEIGVLSGGPETDPTGQTGPKQTLEPGRVALGADGIVTVRTGDGFYRVDRVIVSGQTVPAGEVLIDGEVLI